MIPRSTILYERPSFTACSEFSERERLPDRLSFQVALPVGTRVKDQDDCL